MDIFISNPVELWQRICQTAEFGQRAYDQSLLREIRESLSLPNVGGIKYWILKKQISSEQIIAAVLHALKPFSMMMTDLFDMFATAGAQQSNNNLILSFDFKKGKEEYDIDLESFRQQMSIVQTAVQSAYSVIPESPWTMIRIINNLCNPVESRALPDSINRWLMDYDDCREHRTWPDYFPSQPLLGIDTLDQQVNYLWNIMKTSIFVYRKMGADNRYDIYGDSFWYAETDHWIGCFMRALMKQITLIKSLAEDAKDIRAKDLADSYERIIESLSWIKVESDVTYLFTCLNNILKLPFWKHRYELYSVWISTQIVSALSEKPRFNVINNAIRFSFSGAHIATFDEFDPPLELWAEVRTPYSFPRGEGRKNHIQPDYTLSVGNPKNKDNSVVVVECKQCKRCYHNNFLRATEDYAGGRPNANVLLVNYGPVSNRLSSRLNSGLQKRIDFFGLVYPNSNNVIRFRQRLREIVYNSCNLIYVEQDVQIVSSLSQCVITLEWGSIPRDLDIHLLITYSNKSHDHIYFRNMGKLDKYPFAALDMDDRAGNGMETITMQYFPDNTYDVFVRNYSGEKEINEPVKVSIYCNKQKCEIDHVNPIGRDCLWHVFHIEENTVTTPDKCIDKGNALTHYHLVLDE